MQHSLWGGGWGRGPGPWLLGCVLCAVAGGCGDDRPPSADAGGRDGPTAISENTPADCQDGQDNDGDGFVDCADQDCWPLPFCDASRPDGWKPPPDSGPGDSFPDAPPQTDGVPPADGAVSFDTGLQSCAVHWDCPQGAFCYKGKCLRDQRQPVFHCGKPGCPPGHWCLDQANAKERCAEDPNYVCADACDCGPAHCCMKDAAGIGRCVPHAGDPWLPPGVAPSPGDPQCAAGVDATYCCAAPECHIGKAAYDQTSARARFRCHDGTTGLARAHCGGSVCYGTACKCSAGESCVDTARADAPAGKGCGVHSGGWCVSSAAAEAVFGWTPAELVPCCAKGCVAGTKCDVGWATDAAHAYRRLIGTCGPCADGSWSCGLCGDGTCDAGESPARCPADCRCGDGVCSVGEHATCAPDCGACGDGTCNGLETPQSCAADCGSATCGDARCDRAAEDPFTCPQDCPCPGSGYFAAGRGWCGDRVCESYGACGGPETCQTCAEDCGACAWVRTAGGAAFTAWLHGVWGSSMSDVFAVGANGVILHFDGASWIPMLSGTQARLYAVWGSSASDVFAVGHDTRLNTGVVLHYDGAGWTPMAVGTAASLNGVWGSSASDVFAVGTAGTVLHYDGAGWSPMATGTTANLWGVWGSSPTDVHAVGAQSSGGGAAILHYDGIAWTVSSPASGGLRAVWGRSATDVFAVGYSATLDALLLHFDGTAWQQAGSSFEGDLRAVWGNGQGTVFAVGVAYGSGGENAGLVLRHNGSAWTSVVAGISAPLGGVWGSSATDVFTVGDGGAIVHHDGVSWEATSSSADLNGVWANSPTDVFAVGLAGTILRGGEHGWTPTIASKKQTFYGVWGSSATDVHAVGVLGYGGAFVHFDGSAWKEGSFETAGGWPFTVWGTSSSDVFAAGYGGFFGHFDGAAWTELPASNQGSWEGLWGASATDIYAVGGDYSTGTTILHFDGSNWSTMSAETAAYLYAVWGSSGTDIFAVGQQGTILRCDGASWTPMSSGTQAPLLGVWGSSGTDVYAVGGAYEAASSMTKAVIVHYDGKSWRPFSSYDLRVLTTTGFECSGSLTAVAGSSAQHVVAVGARGMILQRNCPGGACASPTDGGAPLDGGIITLDSGVPLDSGPSPDVAPPADGAAVCGNAVCDLGESCDGRNATVSCPEDCPGGALGNPNKEYCFVNGVCVGAGCQ